jgi:hypothetical protein
MVQNNMLIRPTEEQLADFGEPDFIIYNAGQFPANRFTKGMSSTTSVEINFKRMEMVILGTEYAGEMKKGVFSVMVRSLLPFIPVSLIFFHSTIFNPSSLANCHCTPPPMSESRATMSRSSSGSLAPARLLFLRTRTVSSSATTSTSGPTVVSSTSRVAATPNASTCRPKRNPRFSMPFGLAAF